jgi:integrase
LVDEGELTASPLVGLKPPKADYKVVNALTDDELKRLIKACQGKSPQDRRDEAIVRLMLETGMRASEVIGLLVADVDLHRGLVTIRRGKGGLSSPGESFLEPLMTLSAPGTHPAEAINGCLTARFLYRHAASTFY